VDDAIGGAEKQVIRTCADAASVVLFCGISAILERKCKREGEGSCTSKMEVFSPSGSWIWDTSKKLNDFHYLLAMSEGEYDSLACIEEI